MGTAQRLAICAQRRPSANNNENLEQRSRRAKKNKVWHEFPSESTLEGVALRTPSIGVRGEMDGSAGPMGTSNPPPTAPKAPPRYKPGPWKHNTRVALALIPSIVVVVSDGGRLMMGTLVVGMMVG